MLIFVYSYEKEYIENIKCQPQNRNYHIQASVSRKEKVLEINKQPISKENFEDQDLQQVVELKLKDSTFQNYDEEVKEKKIELIVDNIKNQEMVIIESIFEDPIEVKYEDKTITYNPQIQIDLLKTTTKFIDFLGVENFNFTMDPLLIDVANKRKAYEKKFYSTLYEGHKFQN